MKANIYLGTPLAACPSLLVFPLINLFLRNPQHQHCLGARDRTQSRIFHILRTPDRISSTPESLHPFNPIASLSNSPFLAPTQGWAWPNISCSILCLQWIGVAVWDT